MEKTKLEAVCLETIKRLKADGTVRMGLRCFIQNLPHIGAYNHTNGLWALISDIRALTNTNQTVKTFLCEQ